MRNNLSPAQLTGMTTEQQEALFDSMFGTKPTPAPAPAEESKGPDCTICNDTWTIYPNDPNVAEDCSCVTEWF